MENIDLTIVMLTLNKLPEKWAEFHKETLLKAAGNYPIITLSKKPVGFGLNVIQNEPEGVSNVFYQIYKGAKLATTPYIAIAEDDTLYPRNHFTFFRPDLDTVAYNMNYWSLFTWGEPTYSHRNRIGNLSMIAPRELVIKAMEERFAKFPDGIPEELAGELGRVNVERRLGVSPIKVTCPYSVDPIVTLRHIYSVEETQRTHRKRMAMVRAFDIPTWGRAEELVKKFI